MGRWAESAHRGAGRRPSTGIMLKVAGLERYRKFTPPLYLVLGWLAVIANAEALQPAWTSCPCGARGRAALHGRRDASSRRVAGPVRDLFGLPRVVACLHARGRESALFASERLPDRGRPDVLVGSRTSCRCATERVHRGGVEAEQLGAAPTAVRLPAARGSADTDVGLGPTGTGQRRRACRAPPPRTGRAPRADAVAARSATDRTSATRRIGLTARAWPRRWGSRARARRRRAEQSRGPRAWSSGTVAAYRPARRPLVAAVRDCPPSPRPVPSASVNTGWVQRRRTARARTRRTSVELHSSV